MIGLLIALVAASSTQAPPPSFSAGVEGVYVDVFVTDGTGPVVGLAAPDFELTDNGVRQPVELVTVESLPLTTFLVLDTSGSVEGEKLLRLQAAARALLRELRAGDEAALVTFDQEVRVRVPPTSDRPRLERAVGGILPGGSTALYDALYTGTLLASGRGRSLLVLFTDGEDNLSWLDAEEVRQALLQSNVLVQVVGFSTGEPASSPDVRMGSLAGRRAEGQNEPPYLKTLRLLAEVTGGRFWPASAPDRLAEPFLAILEAMKTRYVLRFEPAHVRREGLHQLKVSLVRRKGRVQSRKAYFVGPRR